MRWYFPVTGDLIVKPHVGGGSAVPRSQRRSRWSTSPARTWRSMTSRWAGPWPLAVCCWVRTKSIDWLYNQIIPNQSMCSAMYVKQTSSLLTLEWCSCHFLDGRGIILSATNKNPKCLPTPMALWMLQQCPLVVRKEMRWHKMAAITHPIRRVCEWCSCVVFLCRWGGAFLCLLWQGQEDGELRDGGLWRDLRGEWRCLLSHCKTGITVVCF